ncbi:hypothetical protein LEMLEM_LOCUS16426, partial [Lemmus lemmus]
IRIACLVGVQIDRPHTQEVAAAVGPSLGDGVTHAAVGQPAGAAHVHPALPGQVELARGGQSCPQPPALIGCLLEGELLRRGGIKDLACEGHITPGGNKGIVIPLSKSALNTDCLSSLNATHQLRQPLLLHILGPKHTLSGSRRFSWRRPESCGFCELETSVVTILLQQQGAATDSSSTPIFHPPPH